MIVNVVLGPYATPSTAAVDFRVIGDAYGRIAIDASGKIVWSSGSAPGDLDIYRSAVGILTLDGALTVTGNLTAANLIAPKVSFPTGQIYALGSVVYFRNLADSSYVSIDANNITARGILSIGADTSLYRSAADVITTDDALVVGGDLTAPKLQFSPNLGQLYALGNVVYFRNTADSGYISIDAQNITARGILTIGADTNLYRAAADVLKTDDSLTVAGVVRSGNFTTAARPTPATAGVGGQIYDTTISKPIWSDGTTWRDAAGAPA